MSNGEGAAGRLTTHVRDLMHGRPAAGLEIALAGLDPTRREIARVVTNADGRCDGPLLAGGAMVAGRYELTFAAGAYFERLGLDLPDPKFLDEVVIRFAISDPAVHYHVPLLLSPYGYSTYRGS
jgi:5-hydroxyisourate hydrolase